MHYIRSTLIKVPNHEDIGGSSNTESTVLGTDTMHVLYTLQTYTKKIIVHLISVENTKS